MPAVSKARKLTRRQHYVPAFYLEHWSNANERIACHDLANDRVFETGCENVLVQSFFYEEDPTQPDNRIENKLAEMEGRASVAFRKIAGWSGRSDQLLCHHIESEVDRTGIELFSEFAAYQYLRVPGAIALKELELTLGSPEKFQATDAGWLNPGLFVEEGYDKVIRQFREMKMTFIVAPGQPFITSDVPCFDFQRSRNLPMLGREIGVDPEATAVLPLSPRVCAIFSHRDFAFPHMMSSGRAHVAPPRLVRNINSMLVERAERYVVSSREEPFIFKVAGKRARGRPLR